MTDTWIRVATREESNLFWRYREQAEQQPWYGGKRTTPTEHEAWFRNTRARLLVIEADYPKRLLGTLRIDSNGEVSYDAEQGDESRVLDIAKGYAAQYGGRIKATVDEDDPRADALEAAGFVESPVRFFTYRP